MVVVDFPTAQGGISAANPFWSDHQLPLQLLEFCGELEELKQA